MKYSSESSQEKPQFFVLAFLIKFVIVQPFLPFNPLDPCPGFGWDENMRTLRSIKTTCKNFWSSVRVGSSKCLNTEFWRDQENTKMILGCTIMNESPQTLWLSLSVPLSHSAGFTLLNVFLTGKYSSKCAHTHCSSHSKPLLGGKKRANKQKEWMPQPTHTVLSLEHCMFL